MPSQRLSRRQKRKRSDNKKKSLLDDSSSDEPSSSEKSAADEQDGLYSGFAEKVPADNGPRKGVAKAKGQAKQGQAKAKAEAKSKSAEAGGHAQGAQHPKSGKIEVLAQHWAQRMEAVLVELPDLSEFDVAFTKKG